MHDRAREVRSASNRDQAHLHKQGAQHDKAKEAIASINLNCNRTNIPFIEQEKTATPDLRHTRAHLPNMALDVKAVDAKRTDLDKAIRDNAPASAVLRILDELKKGVTPSEKLLRETKIGVSVNRLRNHKDPNVQKLANETVTSWRNTMSKLKAQQANSGSSTPKPNGTTSPAPAGSPATVKTEKKTYAGDPAKRNATVDKVDWKVTGSSIRDGCVKLMYDGLAHTSTERMSSSSLIQHYPRGR
jgi:hypothetical protein